MNITQANFTNSAFGVESGQLLDTAFSNFFSKNAT